MMLNFIWSKQALNMFLTKENQNYNMDNLVMLTSHISPHISSKNI